jgi:hypothetical protein
MDHSHMTVHVGSQGSFELHAGAQVTAPFGERPGKGVVDEKQRVVDVRLERSRVALQRVR